MNLARRIERLERDHGGVDRICPHGPRVIHSYGEAWLAGFPVEQGIPKPPPGPEVCPTCGLKRRIFHVIIAFVCREGADYGQDGRIVEPDVLEGVTRPTRPGRRDSPARASG